MHSLKQYQLKNMAFPDLLNWASVVSDGIVLNKDGSLLAGWSYIGQDLSTSTVLERNYVVSIINVTLSQLGSEWMLHQDAKRSPVRAYSSSSESYFPDSITSIIDNERRAYFESEDTHYVSDCTFYLTYLPEKIASSKATEFMFTDGREGAERSVADRSLQQFKQVIHDIEDRLSSVISLTRLKGQPYISNSGTEHIADLLLQHLNETVCGDFHTVNLPPCPMYIDAIIGGHEFWPGIVPRLGRKLIQVVSIEGFPQESFPGILASLDQLPVEYRWNTRFIFLDTTDAQAGIKKYKKRWQQKVRGFVDMAFNPNPTSKSQIDHNALMMVNETDAALTESSQGSVAYGYYTSVVVLMDDDLDKLNHAAREIKRMINNLGFYARVETINCIEAYLGSLPGHAQQNVRRPMLHTQHLANMLPLSTTWAGHEYAPCPMYPSESPALCYASTDGSVPFRFNFHVDDLGHTLMFGPTGAGKSTILALLAAQFRRYPKASIFAFDKGKSLEILTRAVGGDHFNIAGDESEGALSFAPLSDLQSSSNFTWAQDWVVTLLELQNIIITPSHRKEINRALTALRDGQEPKSLTNLRIMIQDSEIKSVLDSYVIGGEYGHIMDAEADQFSVGSWACFELEQLMEMNNRVRLPVLLYLFHVIENKLLGQPALLILDEAWIMLGHDVFKEKIREWLKTLRKANCVVFLATQSLSDASNSGILDVLSESCPTKIFLPNPEAEQGDSPALYRALGCNDIEIRTITRLTRKREYFLKGEGSRRVDFNIGPIGLSFVGATSKEDLNKVRMLETQFGTDWPYRWLDERGVDYAHL
jgi:type IV secretion system protein TrbE